MRLTVSKSLLDKSPLKITLKKKPWEVVLSLDQKNDGTCCRPGQTITIDARQRGKKLLTTIVHEINHAHDWGLTEGEVLMRSGELAEALWKLGYRRAE